MCGIAGYLTEKKYSNEVLDVMLNKLFHRGPDSMGKYASGFYHAGMRRLSINDLAGGNQPLYNEKKDVVLLYNGEIYNYHKLRQELELRGHKFRTHSDGEVICHMYEEAGDGVFESLDGMFAVALWDDRKKELILARDIPGEKPLYYSQLPGGRGIAFASEIKSLSKFPDVNLQLDYQSIWDMPTFLWIPEPDTIYQNIKALMPGHILVANDKGIKIKRYPNLFEKDLDLAGKNDQEIIAEVRRIVEDSVTSRLLSDVPVGSFLSGGLDSSIIATIASQKLGNLSTFTIGFDNLDDPYHGKADESIYASEYAKLIGTRHHTIKVTANDFLAQLDDFTEYGDQPWAVSSGLGVLSVAKAARAAGINVLLTGDGADECFGGYSWYLNLANQQSPKVTKDQDISFQNFGLPLEERLAILNSYPAAKKAWAWHYYASENEKSHIFNKELFVQSQSSLRWFEKFKNDGKWESKDFITHDKCFYFPNEMMRKADRMTMAHSVEGRPPFAAPAILNLAEKIPASLLVRNNQLKWVLRKAFSDILPSEITERPKHGFNVPIDHWLKKEWAFLVDETFSENSALSKMGLINKDSGLVARQMLDDKVRLNGHSIFAFIMLNRWLEKHQK